MFGRKSRGNQRPPPKKALKDTRSMFTDEMQRLNAMLILKKKAIKDTRSMFDRKSRGNGNADADIPVDEKQNKKIRSRLDPGEEITMSIRQSRIRVGGSPIRPTASS